MFVFPAMRAFGQDEVSPRVAGSAVFKTYCAVCHGKEAKGDGPLAGSLRFTPSDLTLIAKRNGGTYPSDQVFRIDRRAQAATGPRRARHAGLGRCLQGDRRWLQRGKGQGQDRGPRRFLETIQVESK